jgi:OOP family OmpA-OmpF porin
MKNSFTKKQVQLAAACAMALGIMSGLANAQSTVVPAADSALLGDTRGLVVVSQFGDCWHSGQGPRPDSTAQCDPNYRAPTPTPVAQYVAPAPAPYVAPAAPVVAPRAAPQPVYEKVTLDADALFDFNKAVLRPAGRDTLDQFVKRIEGVNPSTITAVGHTDRLGSARYNQNLSEERVAAVKTYLVGRGIQPSQVHTSGKGETEPMTKAGDCKGSKSPKLIACLQPDRRVDMEVSGSKLKN